MARTRRWTLVPLAVAVVLVVQGCRSQEDAAPPGSLVHVHGLGVNPRDEALYVATHDGLFRLDDDGDVERVGKTRQDTMGFTVVGPDHFFASGHPDLADEALQRPGKRPLLGLIESRDAGKSWTPRSLLGDADFHTLIAAHDRVYGYDSTGSRFIVSEDMENWAPRSDVVLLDFAVDPDDPDHLVATTDAGLVESLDGGSSFGPTSGPPLRFLSWNLSRGLVGVSATGDLFVRMSASWELRGNVGGAPQALLATATTIYVAIVDGEQTAVRSSRSGSGWRDLYRSRPEA